MPVPFIDNSDFTHQLKSITSKYWPAALAATVAAGGLGGLLASNSKPINETPRQRRRRILRAILLPALSTAGGAAALGLGAAAYNMKNLRNSDPNFEQKIEKAQEILDNRIENRNRAVATGALSVGSAFAVPKVLSVVNSKAPKTLNFVRKVVNKARASAKEFLDSKSIGNNMSPVVKEVAPVVKEVAPHIGVGYVVDSVMHPLYDDAFGTDANSLSTEVIEKLVK